MQAVVWAGLNEGKAAYDRGDFTTAFREFRALAEKGNSEAQTQVGGMYRNGEGVPKDNQQAVFWFRKAAEQGHARAQFFLGAMYHNGTGVPKDHREAVFWYLKAAEQGDARAQGNLGTSYLNGEGVREDHREAVFWYRKSAEQGDKYSQASLGFMYENGRGVPKDDQQAYFWYLLASAQISVLDVNRERLGRLLGAAQRTEAQQAARAWKPKVESEQRSGGQPIAAAPGTPPKPPAAEPVSTGSGFAVTGSHMVTNAHVVAGCVRLSVGSRENAKLIATDVRSDLALLFVEHSLPQAALRSGRVRQGDAVNVVGFPLHGVLASGAQVTTGNVSALAGLQNDTRFIQISAPVQPGNSGGPLVDTSGNVVGVVVSKLDAMKMAAITGDIPQNVNFAVSPLILQGFLDANGVDYRSEPSNKNLSTADVADIAKKFTVLVECWK